MTTSHPVEFTTSTIPKVYLVGDSMTENGFHWQNGWGLELTRRLLRRADVLNRGLGGYTTRSIRALMDAQANDDADHSTSPSSTMSTNGKIQITPDAFLPPLHAEEKVAFCTLFLGTNDSNEAGHFAHVPLAEFCENYEWIARNLLERVEHGLVFILPPPEHGENLLAWLRDYLPMMGIPPPPLDAKPSPERNALLQEYGRAIREIVLKLQEEQSALEHPKFCAVVDSFAAFTETFGDCSSKEALCDGLHFGSKGHDLMVDLVWKALNDNGIGVEAHESNHKLAGLWQCPSPVWYLDEIGASSEKLPRVEPTYSAWW